MAFIAATASSLARLVTDVCVSYSGHSGKQNVLKGEQQRNRTFTFLDFNLVARAESI